MNWPIFHDLQYKHSGTFANRKYEAILITLLKMRPQSSRENATPSSSTSPLAFYKQVPLPPRDTALSTFPFPFLFSPLLSIRSSYPFLLSFTLGKLLAGADLG